MTKPIVGITGEIEKGRYSIRMEYADAVERAGACPVFLSPVPGKNAIRKIADSIDALLISGGRDIHPSFYNERPAASLKLVSDKRFFFENALLKKIMIPKKPVLGICYGMQLLNVFLGGTLYQDLSVQLPDSAIHRSRHLIKIYNNSKLYYILKKENMTVNSSHHQGIKELGRGLTASAISRDVLTEAIELKKYPYFIGVQWHPEKPLNDCSMKLFRSFVRAVSPGRRSSAQ